MYPITESKQTKTNTMSTQTWLPPFFFLAFSLHQVDITMLSSTPKYLDVHQDTCAFLFSEITKSGCNNPETRFVIEDGNITMDCIACGMRSILWVLFWTFC
mgnify:CR=1 FL=1